MITHAVIDGKDVELYKDPITDKDHTKKSQRGLCVVIKNGDTPGEFKYVDGLNRCSLHELEPTNKLKPVFCNGMASDFIPFKDIRAKCRKEMIEWIEKK